MDEQKMDRDMTPKQRVEWHRWFAWHPVMAGSGLVWLRTLERKREWFGGDMYAGAGPCWLWIYRQPAAEPRSTEEKK